MGASAGEVWRGPVPGARPLLLAICVNPTGSAPGAAAKGGARAAGPGLVFLLVNVLAAGEAGANRPGEAAARPGRVPAMPAGELNARCCLRSRAARPWGGRWS